MITPESRLNSIVQRYPHMIEVFNDLAIDYCCGGADTIAEAAQKQNLDPTSLVQLLEKQIKQNPEASSLDQSIQGFQSLDVKAMIDSLMHSHHQSERQMLVELDQLINKLLLVHYRNHADTLVPLHQLFGQLKTELEAHFAKEEQYTFPRMLSAQTDPEVIAEIEQLESEHDAAGQLIHDIQRLTQNFTPPSDGCATYQRAYRVLKALTEDIYVHVFKENALLFPAFLKSLSR